MSTKYKIVILAVLAIIIIVVLVFILLSSNSNPKVTIPSSSGDKIAVNDFISGNPTDSEYATAMVETEEYISQYDKINNAIQIVFTVYSVESLKLARVNAETKLMEQLGINEKEFCKLKVVEIVPDNGVLNLPIYNFPPSFCPGGDVLK